MRGQDILYYFVVKWPDDRYNRHRLDFTLKVSLIQDRIYLHISIHNTHSLYQVRDFLIPLIEVLLSGCTKFCDLVLVTCTIETMMVKTFVEGMLFQCSTYLSQLIIIIVRVISLSLWKNASLDYFSNDLLHSFCVL